MRQKLRKAERKFKKQKNIRLLIFKKQEKAKINKHNCYKKNTEKATREPGKKLSEREKQIQKRFQYFLDNPEIPEKGDLDKFVKERIDFITRSTYLDNLENKNLEPKETEFRFGYGGGIVSSQMWVLKKNNSVYSGYLMNVDLTENSSKMKRYDLQNPRSGWSELFDYLKKNEVKIPLDEEILNDFMYGVDLSGFTLEIKEEENYQYRWFLHTGCKTKGRELMENILNKLYKEFQNDLPEKYNNQN